MSNKRIGRVSPEEFLRVETVRAFGLVLHSIDPGSRQEVARDALLAEITWHRRNAKVGAFYTYSKLKRRFLNLMEQALTRSGSK